MTSGQPKVVEVSGYGNDEGGGMGAAFRRCISRSAHLDVASEILHNRRRCLRFVCFLFVATTGGSRSTPEETQSRWVALGGVRALMRVLPAGSGYLGLHLEPATRQLRPWLPAAHANE